jgi:predicted lipoprotein with Yx(FWY)xxD motif
MLNPSSHPTPPTQKEATQMNRIRAIAGVLAATAIVTAVLILTGSGATQNRTANAATATAGTTYRHGAPAPTSGANRAGTIIEAHASSLGRLLTDGQGRTLYLFEADKPNVSTLSGAGLAIWPPVPAAGTPRTRRGALAAKLATITGANGKPQLTYDHHPLYYYVGDSKPGQTNGQGLNQFGAEWYVLAPSGDKIDNG